MINIIDINRIILQSLLSRNNGVLLHSDATAYCSRSDLSAALLELRINGPIERRRQST